MLSMPIGDEMVSLEEQKNYINLLKKTIESDLIKNGLLTRYITPEGVIELTRIKSEAEEYRKQLVTAQSLINSLKSDVEDLTKGNKKLKEEIESLNGNLSNVGEMEGLKRENQNLNKINEVLVKDKTSIEKNISQIKLDNEHLIKQNKELTDKIANFYKFTEEQNEETNKRLNEYKNSYEKICNDFEKLLIEKNALQEQNAQLTNENNQYHDDLCSLEVKMDKFNSGKNTIMEKKINEGYKKMYNELLLENSNLKKVINKNTQNNSQNESPFVNQNMGDYYSKLQAEYSKLQIENEKIKIDLSNLHKEKQNTEKENEILKSKFKNLNIEKVKLHLEYEKILKALNCLEEKYTNEIQTKSNVIRNYEDEISKAKMQSDENTKQSLSLNNEYEEIVKKFNYLNDKYQESENKIFTLENQMYMITNERDKIKKLNYENEKKIKFLESKCDQYENDNTTFKSSEMKLKQIIEETENKVEETLLYNNRINTQIRGMEEELKTKNKILSNMKVQKEKYEDEIEEKVKIFDEYIGETKRNIRSLLNQLSQIATEFHKMANKDLNSLFTKTFLHGTSEVLIQINSINNIVDYDVHLNDKLFYETISKFLFILSKELENIYEKIFDSNKCIEESYSRINSLEVEMKMRNEQKFGNVQKTINEFERQLNGMKNEKNNLYKDFTGIKSKNYSLEVEIDKLKIENNELKAQVCDLAEKIIQSENKVNLVVKSRKNLLDVIRKFIMAFPNKDAIRMMMDILNVTESISKYELEKTIIEDKLVVMNKENNVLMKDKSYKNSDLFNIVQAENEKLKKLYLDFEGKLNVKREKLKALNDYYEKYSNPLNV